MTNSKAIISALKEACQITGADWAACAERNERDSAAWKFESLYKVNQKRRVFAENYFNLGTVDNWLCGALTEGKSRSRKIPNDLDLGSVRLYAFPVQGTQKIVFVGGEGIRKTREKDLATSREFRELFPDK
ncbi:MAG: hypothetical protein HN975_03140 [Anaerolineae bacterium]|jgi:hypothetical protein|nr:hypothetical protein [Anaerolineae bacterium]